MHAHVHRGDGALNFTHCANYVSIWSLGLVLCFACVSEMVFLPHSLGLPLPIMMSPESRHGSALHFPWQEIHRSREDVWEVPFVSGRIVDTQLAHTLAFFVKSISRKISWNQFHEFFFKKMWILAFEVILPSLETNTWYGNNFSSFRFSRARRILIKQIPEQSVYAFIASGIQP